MSADSFSFRIFSEQSYEVKKLLIVYPGSSQPSSQGYSVKYLCILFVCVYVCMYIVYDAVSLYGSKKS